VGKTESSLQFKELLKNYAKEILCSPQSFWHLLPGTLQKILPNSDVDSQLAKQEDSFHS
jgi:hypothetical protein